MAPHPRTFRFGAELKEPLDGRSWGESARRVEDLGYDVLSMPDHFSEQWGVLSCLGSAAEATTTLKLGSLVFGNDYRHPVVLAKEIATIDQLSNGRAEFGLGAGWLRTDYDVAGLDYDRPGVRIDRLVESVEIIQRLFSQESVTYNGVHYSITDYTSLPRPVQDGGPPLMIGGGGKRMLRTAATYADIVAITASLRSGAMDESAAADSLAAAYDQKLEWLRAAAGDRFDSLELSSLTMAVNVTTDPDGPAAFFADLFGTSPEEVLESPAVLVGSIDEICETLEARRRRWGFSYVCVRGEDIEAFGPVVARLHGR